MPRRQDEYYDDLMGVDLSAIDLDDIEIEEESGSGWRWVAGIAVLALGGVVLWLPNSQFYQQYGHTSWLFFAVCGGAIIFGFTFGRWFLGWAATAAERYARTRRNRARQPPKPPSAVTRWLTLMVASGGGAVLLFGLPSSDYGSGTGFGFEWFLAAGGAVAVGLLLGRWLLMQQNVSRATRAPRKPVELPSWFKWVTLTFLLGLAGLALFGTSVFNSDDPQSLEFAMGGVAFVVGVVGAIWLVRRFDETEKRQRNKALRKRRGDDTLPGRTGQSSWNRS